MKESMETGSLVIQYNHKCLKCGITWTHEKCTLEGTNMVSDGGVCDYCCGDPPSDHRTYNPEEEVSLYGVAGVDGAW